MERIKIYRNEKTKAVMRMILFIELFAKVRCFGFYNFISACKLFNDSHTLMKVLNQNVNFS